MSEHSAVITKQDPIIEMLLKYKNTIASVLPKHFTPERMLRIASTVIFRTPKLRECTPLSLVNAVIEISMLGLDIGRTAHIVPFKREAVVIIDYKGFIELAHRSGQINSFPFKPVYENDIFEYEEGTNRFIKHKPATKERGTLIAAYAICNFKHGGFDFEVVHPADIDAIKKIAPGAKFSDSPWNDSDQEWTMWCKSAVRRLAKRIPQSPELRRATELEDLVEAGLKQQIGYIAESLIPEGTQPAYENRKPEAKDTKEAVNAKLASLKQAGQTQLETVGHGTNNEEWHCNKCSFVSQSERGLKKHITQSHPEKVEEKKPEPPPSVVDFGETEEPPQEPKDDPRPRMRELIRNFKAELRPEAWDAIEKYFRGWETDKADIESLNAMLKQCEKALDRQNAG